MGYAESGWERVMRVQQVMMRALSGEIHWFRAAAILGVDMRTMRRWREAFEHRGCHALFDRRPSMPRPPRRSPPGAPPSAPARQSIRDYAWADTEFLSAYTPPNGRSAGAGREVLAEVFRGNFTMVGERIYFTPQLDAGCGCYHLQWLDLTTGKRNPLMDIRDVGGGLSVASDGRSLLYTAVVHTSADLLLVEGFR